MTSSVFQAMARSIAGSALGEPAVLETAAHGTIRCRVTFHRREVIHTDRDGRAEFETSEPMMMVQSAIAPRLDQDDVVYVDGQLWQVRTALDDGSGQIKCALVAPQYEEVLRAGVESRDVAFVGSPKVEGIAIVKAGDAWGVGDSFDAGDRWVIAGVDSWVPGFRRLRIAIA